MVARLCTVPLANGWLLFALYPCCLEVALVVDEVAVCHSRVALRLRAKTRTMSSRPLSEGKFLREHVDAKDLALFGCITILAGNTLRPFLFFHFLKLLEEVVGCTLLLQPHLGEVLRFLRALSLFPLFLVDNLLETGANFAIS